MISQLMVPMLLIASVSAQNQDCNQTNFGACQTVVADYKKNTCDTLRNHPNYFKECLCYQAVANGNCYQQCPGNAGLQASYQSVVLPQIRAVCSNAGLDPNNLPVQASWVGTGINDGPLPVSSELKVTIGHSIALSAAFAALI
ncbi:hypothetical protein BC833DRAFT_617921 [Globomyces pollinis-pini]|nr:hypothetical protein BC833DRAFT_617921 [Globomyces pollinis-pini]